MPRKIKDKPINKKNIATIVIAAFIVAAFATTGGMCEFLRFIGGTLIPFGVYGHHVRQYF